jgi:hypothetical protein
VWTSANFVAGFQTEYYLIVNTLAFAFCAAAVTYVIARYHRSPLEALWPALDWMLIDILHHLHRGEGTFNGHVVIGRCTDCNAELTADSARWDLSAKLHCPSCCRKKSLRGLAISQTINLLALIAVGIAVIGFSLTLSLR